MIKDFLTVPCVVADATMYCVSYGTFDEDKLWPQGWKYHRIAGPAKYYYYFWSCSEIYLIHKEWWINGLLHRVDGPAITHIQCTPPSTKNYSFLECDRKISTENYYLLDEEITKEDFNTPGFIDAFILEHS